MIAHKPKKTKNVTVSKMRGALHCHDAAGGATIADSMAASTMSADETITYLTSRRRASTSTARKHAMGVDETVA